MAKRAACLIGLLGLIAACAEQDAPGITGPGAGGSGATSAGTTGSAGTGGSTVTPTDDQTITSASCSGAPLPTNMPSRSLPLALPSTSQQVAPPAISGGTLRVLADGTTAVAADPDRDQVYIVDLNARALTATIVLSPADEPGRVVQDASGLVHVALRGGGAVVSIDPATGQQTDRRPVCAAPRGIAYDGATDLLHVACAGGELVSLPAAGGDAVRSLVLDPDLRDVVIDGDRLRVTRFRAAELLTVEADGTVSERISLPTFRSAAVRGGQGFTPAIAWRAMGMPDGGVAMVHQRGVDDEVQTQVVGGYGGRDNCNTIVHSCVSVVGRDGAIASGPALGNMPLPVDMALSPSGTTIAIVSAANTHAAFPGSMQGSLLVQDVGPISDGTKTGTGCQVGTGGVNGCASTSCSGRTPTVTGFGEPIAVAYAGNGDVIVQSREPAALFVPNSSPITLSTVSRADGGHAVFHVNAGGGLACASCHAEGRDDARSWKFACSGLRRTQSLQVGLRGTEPFHWNGDESDFPTLVHDVFSNRMSGPALADGTIDMTLSWIDAQPRMRRAAPADTSAADRGRALFTSAACASCHTGEHFTNNQTVDVGTGGKFQVPSLINVATRAPYLHNGCAATLRDRFSPACGGGDKHGLTSKLTGDELSDLIAYLETL